jgi:UDP-N-acetyl-D-glucosamine dehydrogenase
MINDPYIPKFKHKGKEYISVDWELEIKNADIVIITTDHSNYDYEKLVAEASLLYDTRNATKHVKNNREKINKL